MHHWAQGGPTTLSNLALLCRRHHRAVHEEGYQVERGPDGALQFRRPDGRPLPDVPAPAAVPADPAGASGRRTPRRGSIFMRARASSGGWASGWTWAGRSTCCIRGRRDPVRDRRSRLPAQRRKYEAIRHSERGAAEHAQAEACPRSIDTSFQCAHVSIGEVVIREQEPFGDAGPARAGGIVPDDARSGRAGRARGSACSPEPLDGLARAGGGQRDLHLAVQLGRPDRLEEQRGDAESAAARLILFLQAPAGDEDHAARSGRGRGAARPRPSRSSPPCPTLVMTRSKPPGTKTRRASAPARPRAARGGPRLQHLAQDRSCTCGSLSTSRMRPLRAMPGSPPRGGRRRVAVHADRAGRS